jgi:hypothetical protein
MFELQLVDRLSEMPYRLRPPSHIDTQTWPVSQEELSRVSVGWPTQYEWPDGAYILESIKGALAKLGVIHEDRTPQVHSGVVMLYCAVDGELHPVAYDYSDYHDFINESALAQSRLYIKCQHRVQGYPDPRIVPGGYIVTTRRYYRYYMPFRRRGNLAPTIDVVGRFGFAFQGELRRRAVALLADALDIRFAGNTGKVRYSRFLREVAGARLSLHLPGNGPFTHRVAEFLGLGTCMISVPFATALHVPLIPGIHYVEIKHDLSDLLEKIRYYLQHEDERNRIAAAGREYFDKYLHQEQLVSYYIHLILERLGDSREPSSHPITPEDRVTSGI